jgi:hypothetical protein
MMMKTTGSNGPSEKETGKDAYTLFNLCLCCIYPMLWAARYICVSWPCQARARLQPTEFMNIQLSRKREEN